MTEAYNWRVLERHSLSGGAFQAVAAFFAEQRARDFCDHERARWPGSQFKLQRSGPEAWIDVER